MTAKKRKYYFNSISKCNRFLSKIINETYNGEIEDTKAGRLAYMINILINSIRTGELEARIEALEKKIN